jgi:hypothetical protein
MDKYLAKHAFVVIRQKPWGTHAGGQIYELSHCPFNKDHVQGSAAFTLVDGKPGFRCQHDGCRGKTIKHVFSEYPADRRTRKDHASGNDNEAGEKSGPTQSQLLIELAANAELFHTPEGQAFASIPVAGHREIWLIKSRGFRQWLTHELFKKIGKPPSAQALQDTVALLEAKARFASFAAPVFTRIASFADCIYVDLSNENWEVVAVSPQGWTVVQNPPVRFRRAKGMLPLPTPILGGSTSILRRLINIGGDRNWILLLSWLIAACRPNGPYPILILVGEQGSAKSTTARFIRSLIDPSIAAVRTAPRDERDLVIAASNSWVVAFDNLSGVPPWLSDAFCRLATGTGFSTRELYSDTEEVIIGVARPVILNGIDHLAERADLADRAVILNVPQIDPIARREESEVLAEYEQALPQILGALLTALSATMARFPSVHLSPKPRMADFAAWATAAEEPFGFMHGAFMKAYSGNRADAVRETLDADAVSAAMLVVFNQDDGECPWSGTTTELLARLNRAVDDGTKKSKGWPRNAKGLSTRLRRVVTFLRESGISISFPQGKSTAGARILTVTRTEVQNTATIATTAAELPASPANQRVSGHPSSGGPSTLIDSTATPELQPPLERAAIPLPDAATLNNRVDLCSQCGPTDWNWDGSARAWVCVACGATARECSAPGLSTVDSAAEDEGPMSPEDSVHGSF